jgi:hypothetical protein
MAPLLRFFNLDLHISVIADVKHILNTLYGQKIEIVNWSISGHNWVFQEPNPDVKIINQRTWRNIDARMISEFQTLYDDFLSQFDGFIVTHTPVFCMLYEKYGKPIILVNSCRYEQPYSWLADFRGWSWLSTGLRRMSDRGQLIAVSNNKADQEYLRRGTGIVSTRIPSLCLYTGASHRPIHSAAVVHGSRSFFPACDALVAKPDQYSWADLYSYKAIVHIPYEMSTMSLFEQYSAGVPLFLPSREFYVQCIMDGSMSFGSIYSSQHDPRLLESSDLPSELKEALLSGDFWLDRADFYDSDNFKYIRFYSSREDLVQQITTFVDTDREARLAWIAQRAVGVYDIWRALFFKHFFGTMTVSQLCQISV